MGKCTNCKMDKKFFFNLDIQKSGVDEQSGQFFVEGYAATSDLDRQGDIIAIEALKAAADIMIQNGQTVFFNHNYDRCIGRLENTVVDEIGMKVKIYVSEWEEEIRKKIEEKIINKFSVGGRMLSSRVISPDEATQRFPDKIKSKPTTPINLIEKMELFEVSIVGLPANAKAEFIHKSLYDALKEEVTKVEEVKQEEKVEIDVTQVKELVEGAAKAAETKVICAACKAEIDTSSLPEVKPGVVACPKCGAEINAKTGEVVPAEEVKPAEEKPAEEKPAEEKPAEEAKVCAPTEEKPVEEKPKEEAPVEGPKKPYYTYGKDTQEKLDKLVVAVDGLIAKIDELAKVVSQLAQPQKSEETAKILEIITDLNSKVKEIPVAVQKTTPIVASEIKKEIVQPKIVTPEMSFLSVLKGV